MSKEEQVSKISSRTSEYEKIYTDEELQTYVELINALYPWLSEWRLIKARKDHDDELFGDSISEGDFYYKRTVGSPWNALKVSRRSMDSLIFCLFNGNPGLERLVKEFRQEMQEKMQTLMRDTAEQFSPLATLMQTN